MEAINEQSLQYEYRVATIDDLNAIWEKNITDNTGDNRWIRWKTEAIKDNRIGICKTFVIVYNGKPIGEGTLLLSPECSAVNGRTEIADGINIVNINALRNDKAHEGKGHISKLVAMMEKYALAAGYTTITIGVEAKETRNLAIYLHWGYDIFVESELEEGSLVLYYSKVLKK